MGDATENREKFNLSMQNNGRLSLSMQNNEKLNLFIQSNGFSRDLMHKNMQLPSKTRSFEEVENDEDGELELSLGLSLNGKFGVDPTRAAKKLKRSNSISGFVVRMGPGGNVSISHARGVASGLHAPLVRTCSMPVEAGEEWRRRKEEQTARRLEARRKRMEKMKNVREREKEKESSSEDRERENNNGGGGLALQLHGGFVNGCLVENPVSNVNGNVMISSQGSIGSSQGSGSSGISDQSQQNSEGAKPNAEMKSPSSVQSIPKPIAPRPQVGAAEHDTEERAMLKKVMFEMPCVSTRGGGPGGKKVDGFLYRYKKGEEVKIMCVCHGNFLSPAEFVKHAGGGDVENPSRHIVVNHSPFL